MLTTSIRNLKVFLAMDLGENWHQNKYSIRLHFFALSFLCALLLWIYSGLLVGYFALESDTIPITSFDDLITKPNLQFRMVEGYSATQGFIRATKDHPELGKLAINVIC